MLKKLHYWDLMASLNQGIQTGWTLTIFCNSYFSRKVGVGFPRNRLQRHFEVSDGGSLLPDYKWNRDHEFSNLVWRILCFVSLFSFLKTRREILRFFWGLGQNKKGCDSRVRTTQLQLVGRKSCIVS